MFRAELTREQALAERITRQGSLVGHGLHMFVACDVCGKRRVQQQGEIVRQVAPTTHLVQLFSWLGGEPTTQRVVTLEDMRDCDPYSDVTEMNFPNWNPSNTGAGKKQKALGERIVLAAKRLENAMRDNSYTP